MDADTIERLRQEHVPWSGFVGNINCHCGAPWPCDTARLLEVLTTEVRAVAELLALERAGKVAWYHNADLPAQWTARIMDTSWPNGWRPAIASTAVELLAEVHKALTEATDA